ncbi:MAG TPA: BatD family protein [Chitinophagaceae bacterium]
MIHKTTILLTLLLTVANVKAQQQPPAQLPSLLEGTTQMPVLHDNENPDDFIRSHIFVKVSASKNTVYAGEPLLVTYRLYTSLNSQARVSKQPSFNGCSVLELSADNDIHEATINGTQFHVFTIRRVQIIPLEEGILQLAPAFVDNIVQLLHEGSGIENFSITLSNDPLNIEVKPLPVNGKPKDFSGLLGRFTIAANIDTNKLPAGENAILRVVIRGSGNIAGIHIPAIQWPIGTEHFEGSDTQYIDQENFPVTGYKIFEVPFIGDREGKAMIAPIAFSYFDPLLEAYETITTNSIPVTFTKAIGRSEQMKDIVTEDVSNKKYLWIVGAIAISVICIWLVASRLKSNQKNQNKLLAKQQNGVTTKLEVPPPLKNDASEIFAELNKLGSIQMTADFLSSTKYFLIKTLQAKLEAPSVSEHELIFLMRQTKEFTEIAMSCEVIFDTCDRNLYSLATEENVQEKIYFELTSVVKKMYELS